MSVAILFAWVAVTVAILFAWAAVTVAILFAWAGSDGEDMILEFKAVAVTYYSKPMYKPRYR